MEKENTRELAKNLAEKHPYSREDIELVIMALNAATADGTGVNGALKIVKNGIKIREDMEKAFSHLLRRKRISVDMKEEMVNISSIVSSYHLLMLEAESSQ